ncbi:MAG: DUF2752 domain-containing protein [Bacteroidia bacterium]|nr:DUF2752 domain-containing protein [Bacteroidia bacterium]
MRFALFLTELLTRAALMILLPVAWGLPASYFDEGESICYWKTHYGIECPGCGLTRGIHHTLHGEWEVGLEFNPLSLPLSVGLLVIWLLNFWGFYKMLRYTKDFQTPTQQLLISWLQRLEILSK